MGSILRNHSTLWVKQERTDPEISTSTKQLKQCYRNAGWFKKTKKQRRLEAIQYKSPRISTPTPQEPSHLFKAFFCYGLRNLLRIQLQMAGRPGPAERRTSALSLPVNVLTLHSWTQPGITTGASSPRSTSTMKLLKASGNKSFCLSVYSPRVTLASFLTLVCKDYELHPPETRSANL